MMRNITINIPNLYDEIIQKLKSKKILVSRSETFRHAIREFLEHQSKVNQQFSEVLKL